MGPFQNIREKIAKRFESSRKTKAPHGCIPNAQLEELLIETRRHFPDRPVWERIDHPRDNYFSVYVMPLVLPLLEPLKEPMLDIKKQMINDGIAPEQSQIQSRYEQRAAHLWLAEMQRWTFRPIGVVSFAHEKRMDVQTGSKGAVDNWWLLHAWLNSAQRNHQILRNTVPYFQKWYPNFVVAREHPIVARSLRAYPQHLSKAKPTSMMWEDGE